MTQGYRPQLRLLQDRLRGGPARETSWSTRAGGTRGVCRGRYEDVKLPEIRVHGNREWRCSEEILRCLRKRHRPGHSMVRRSWRSTSVSAAPRTNILVMSLLLRPVLLGFQHATCSAPSHSVASNANKKPLTTYAAIAKPFRTIVFYSIVVVVGGPVRSAIVKQQCTHSTCCHLPVHIGIRKNPESRGPSSRCTVLLARVSNEIPIRFAYIYGSAFPTTSGLDYTVCRPKD